MVANRLERIITQLKALVEQSVAYYKDDTNRNRADALIYQEGDKVYVNLKNIKTNRLIKKGDDR